jgi:hypothetical protein
VELFQGWCNQDKERTGEVFVFVICGYYRGQKWLKMEKTGQCEYFIATKTVFSQGEKEYDEQDSERKISYHKRGRPTPQRQ